MGKLTAWSPASHRSEVQDLRFEKDDTFCIGADVSKGQWVIIKLSEGGSWDVDLSPTINEIWDRYCSARLVLVDVPIGLHEDGAEERQCDREARRLLGWPRRSSVFRVPCRSALEASSYGETKRINKSRTGKSLAIQSWGIIAKIREVDEFLNENIIARSKIREIHPEVCFWALNGRKAADSGKKTPEGISERGEILRRAYNQTDAILTFARRKFHGKVNDDDILDALAGAVTALLGEQQIVTLPEKPEIDSRGLPMEMVYYLVPSPVPPPSQL